MVTRADLPTLSRGADQDVEAYNDRLKMLLQGKQAQQQQEHGINRALQLKQQLETGGPGRKYNIGLSPGGGVSIGESEVDPTNVGLRKQSMENLEEERRRKAVQDIEDRSTKANTANIVPSMKRAESAIPGLFTKEDSDPVYKSVGGGKQLIPNMVVPPLEAIGLLPKGSGEERTALQELSNAKIYDSSGKQINEAEMKRIVDAMGLSGMFSGDSITKALRQAGYTVLEKQKTVTAGARPEDVETFKSRGGLVGAKTLPELLGRPRTGKNEIRRQTHPKTGAVRIFYDDNTSEVVTK